MFLSLAEESGELTIRVHALVPSMVGKKVPFMKQIGSQLLVGRGSDPQRRDEGRGLCWKPGFGEHHSSFVGEQFSDFASCKSVYSLMRRNEGAYEGE